MRIAHWCNFNPPTGISGLLSTVRELVEAELEMGIDAGICDASSPEDSKGGKEIPLRRKTVKTKPWSWALEEDCVSILSTGLHETFHKLPHKIAILHGMPSHCVFIELYQRRAAMGTSMNLPRMVDHSVCWSKQEAEAWSCFAPNVEYLERGCDLDFWKPEGDEGDPNATFTRRFHPQISFLDIQRPVKWPLTFLLAVKYVSQRPGMENMRFQFGNVESKAQLLWMQIITKLDIDPILSDYIVGVHTQPWRYFRSSDLLVSPCQGGLMSRVAIEALACGCPTIILEGAREKVATMKCHDTPLSMADAIETVWSRVQEDPEGIREEARKIAEEHYNIKDTVKGFLKIADNLV